jgi:hypothetical protein
MARSLRRILYGAFPKIAPGETDTGSHAFGLLAVAALREAASARLVSDEPNG